MKKLFKKPFFIAMIIFVFIAILFISSLTEETKLGSIVRSLPQASPADKLTRLTTSPSPTTDRIYNVGGALYFNGIPVASTTATGGITPSTAGYLAYYPGTGTTINGTSSIYIDAATKYVGIGTTTGLGSKLNLYNNLTFFRDFQITDSSSSTPVFSIFHTSSGNFNDLLLSNERTGGDIMLSNGIGSNGLFVSSSNLVAIGTSTNFSARLTAYNSGTEDAFNVIQPNANTYAMRIFNKSTSTTKGVFAAWGENNGDLKIGNELNGGNINFITGNSFTSRMFINGSAGYIGIGTTTPSNLLSLGTGNILLQNAYGLRARTSTGEEQSILLAYSDNKTYLDGTSGIVFRPNQSTTNMVVNTTTVGIGTTTPTAVFQATTASANATTSVELGKALQNKGTCLVMYNNVGTVTYCSITGTTLACSATSCK